MTVKASEVVSLALGVRLASDAATLAGASVGIAARAAVSLALARHELATNAARHGALSHAEGKLAITWSHRAGPAEVDLAWIEATTNDVGKPEHENLGLRLLRSLVERDLGGRIQLDFRRSGLDARMTFRAAGATA